MCLNCNLYLWWDSISLLIFFSLDVVCNNNDFPYFVYALRLRRQSLIKVNIIVFICFIAKIFCVAFRSHHKFLVTLRKRQILCEAKNKNNYKIFMCTSRAGIFSKFRAMLKSCITDLCIISLLLKHIQFLWPICQIWVKKRSNCSSLYDAWFSKVYWIDEMKKWLLWRTNSHQ